MRTYSFAALFLLVGLAWGCDEEENKEGDPTDEEVPAACQAPPAEDKGECVEYRPSEVAGTHEGVWTEEKATDSVRVDIEDPGGGLVRVKLKTAEVATTSFVRLVGNDDGLIQYGADVYTPTLERSFVFRAQGKKSYEIHLARINNYFADVKDGSYSVEWSYEPNVDCYEDNDTVETAKRIPLNQPIQAYAHAGIVEGDGVMVGPSIYDFYKFELEEPTTVRLRATRPSDTALVFEFWDAETNYGLFVGTDLFAPAGQPSESDDLELEAGTHYVRVSTFVSQYSSALVEDGFPADWNEPYTLEVLAAAAPRAAGGDEKVACLPAAKPPAVLEDECYEYEPAVVEGHHEGAWSEGRLTDSVRIHIGDPGGGLVRVTLSAAEAPTTSHVRLAGATEEFTHYGIDVFTPTLERSFVFRAQGNRSYDIFLASINNYIADIEDLGYSVEWSYEPNIDCYEDNDTVETAKRVPLGEPITAYLHAGIIEGDGTFVGPSGNDYYKFVLDEPTTVELAATKPSDTAITFEFWDPEADYTLFVGTDMLAAAGEESVSEPLELEAGVHYVRVSTFVSQSSSASVEDGFPADWNEPYLLTVRRVSP